MRGLKKIFGLMLALVGVVGCFAACGGEKKENDPTIGAKYKDMNAIEFTEAMGNGINLGNTMEAYGHASFGTNSATSVYETAWGMPVTTKEMIQGMKDAGFDSLRIPVAWTNMMNYESGDYKINQAYVDRVGEIIQWAIDADMIVVVNDHWDGGWWAMFGQEDQATKDKAWALYESMWTQLAEAYKDYDYHLVFESGNEELGDRFNDEWNKKVGVLSKDECYELTTKVNQKFVDIIRKTGGGYNKDRFLLCAGYNTDITNTCDDRYKMPTDTAKEKLLISVHYYTPSGYCIESGITSWYKKTNVEEMNTLLQKMTKFTDQGYGVVIGEWGVLIEGKTELKKDTSEFMNNFLANCDYYGFCPVLWDCNSMYNRKECKMEYNEVAKIFTKAKETLPENVKAAAESTIKKMLNNAPAGEIVPDDEARAWIMFANTDYTAQYKVGDAYPDAQAEGIVATDVKVTGAGTYTVSLDFTGVPGGKATGIAFSALGILHGEDLFPGYIIDIKEIKINGEVYEMKGKPYTTSDDASCTRVNLYNGWVPDENIPMDKIRVPGGDTTGVTAMPVDGPNVGDITTIEVTFEYIAP